MTSFVVGRPRLVLAVVFALTGVALAYTAEHFQLSSDTSKLVRQDAPFRQHYRELVRAFPHYDQSILVVVSADDASVASAAAERLAGAMRSRPDVLQSVYSIHAPDGEPFFENNGLLYLDLPDVERVIDRLAEAQSAVATLARDPSLRGIGGQLTLALDSVEPGSELPSSFARIADRVSEVGERLLAGEPSAMRWQRELAGVGSDRAHRVISAQPNMSGGMRRAGQAAVAAIRELAVEQGLTPENGVEVRLTGMVPLATEELDSARDSLGLAALLSFLALAAIMVFGIRSLRVIVATLTTVVVGIIWTAALGQVAFGEFNVLSMGFAVLMIGMSVDFGIHFCLHYLEGLEGGASAPAAAVDASVGVGIPLLLCALTSSIGFFSFLPTDYRGLAQLGLVSGCGMFIALLATFTVCPAILIALGPARGRPPELRVSGALVAALVRHAGTVSLVSLLIGAAAAMMSTRMTFDFSTLSMKDPRSESMRALRDLERDGILTDYALTVLAPSWTDVGPLAERLERLPAVAEVRTPTDYLPADQDRKLELLEEAELFLWPALQVAHVEPPPTPTERAAALAGLRTAALRVAADGGSGDRGTQAARRLAAVLARLEGAGDAARLEAEYETLVIGDFPALLDRLRTAVQASRLTFDDLPEALRHRLVSEDGRVVLSVVPRDDLGDVDALRRFVGEVESVAPNATGRASVEVGIGGIVVRSFHQAMGISAVIIVLVLFLTLRDVLDTILVLVPLALSALGTIAIGELCGIHFNMSNVVAIPLIMGVGVDNGIHVVLRYRREGSLAGVLESSTPRAIILSGLTTLGAFGALSFSTHLGIRSMGVLLSIALVLLMLTTVLVLPALVTWRDARFGASS